MTGTHPTTGMMIAICAVLTTVIIDQTTTMIAIHIDGTTGPTANMMIAEIETIEVVIEMIAEVKVVCLTTETMIGTIGTAETAMMIEIETTVTGTTTRMTAEA
jgi:hypothetical protein